MTISRLIKTPPPPPPWGDLGQDLVGFILRKLPDAVDVFRFRAVCKNWRHAYIPKDSMIKHKNHLWRCHLKWVVGSKLLKCKIIDPSTCRTFKTMKQVWRYGDFNNILRKIIYFGSDGDWLIAGSPINISIKKWELFVYNPYTKVFLGLPRINYHIWCATVSCIIKPRVFVLGFEKVGRWYVNYIAIYDKSKGWRSEFVGATQVGCCGMKYMNGGLFCLFRNGVLKRYGLADGSWTSLDLGEGSYKLGGPNKRLYLVNTVGDCLASCEFDCHSGKKLTFVFDWSIMSWKRSDTPSVNEFSKEFVIRPPRIG